MSPPATPLSGVRTPRLWATALLLVAGVLAGCGASPSATVFDAVEAGRSAESLRFVAETEGELSGAPFHLSVVGARSGPTTQITVTTTVNGVGSTFDLISTATRGYAHKPAGGCFPEEGWYRDDPYLGTSSAFENPIDLAFGPFPDAGLDPEDYFSTEFIGRETVSDVAMDHFSVDLLVPRFKTYGLVTAYEVWIDEHGRPRQITLERRREVDTGVGRFFGNRVLLALLAGPPGIAFDGEMTFSTEIQFFDFGLPIQITPPAESTEISEGGHLFILGTCPD